MKLFVITAYHKKNNAMSLVKKGQLCLSSTSYIILIGNVIYLAIMIVCSLLFSLDIGIKEVQTIKKLLHKATH